MCSMGSEKFEILVSVVLGLWEVGAMLGAWFSHSKTKLGETGEIGERGELGSGFLFDFSVVLTSAR